MPNSTLPESRVPVPVVLNLALQGGGAHGAFTWGVLDRLLATPSLSFEGLSGSSAGAINAAVLADGWINGGREGARTALEGFWSDLSRLMPPALVIPGAGDGIYVSLASKLLTSWAGQFAPTQWNPFDLNPLRDLLVKRIDFKRLRSRSPFKLFIAATQATNGTLRLFREHELTVDMLLASACLPKVHRPVEIDGVAFWDGGYTANPAIFPLFYDCESQDVLLVPLTPLRRDSVPSTAKEIRERITELSFNATFTREIQTFVRAAAYAAQSEGTPGRLEAKLCGMRFHMIDIGRLPSLEDTETRALAYAPLLELLCNQGRERAGAWIDQNLAAVGVHPSIDLQKWFG